MDEVIFVTHNKGKIASAKKQLKNVNFKIFEYELEEPRSDDIKENIHKEVVEYFDEMDQSNINEPPCFSCEKCGGIMRPKEYTGVYGIKY